MTDPLPRSFYARPALTVARELLGARLVRLLPNGVRVSGRIVETEAYTGRDDVASHGRKQPTKRNQPMYGLPGHAFVYFTYGNWWMPNVVVEEEGHPAAVLFRAIDPVEGLDEMAARRPDRPPLEWTSGPAKLALALDIGKEFNMADMTTTESGLWIEPDQTIPDDLVRSGPRVGMGKTPEPWFSMPWRRWVGGNLYVSKGSGKKG